MLPSFSSPLSSISFDSSSDSSKNLTTHYCKCKSREVCQTKTFENQILCSHNIYWVIVFCISRAMPKKIVFAITIVRYKGVCYVGVFPWEFDRDSVGSTKKCPLLHDVHCIPCPLSTDLTVQSSSGDRSKPYVFLIFSLGRERVHWERMG